MVICADPHESDIQDKDTLLSTNSIEGNGGDVRDKDSFVSLNILERDNEFEGNGELFM
jgi:hypothetical protein